MEQQTASAGGATGKREPSLTFGGLQTGATAIEISVKILKKLTISLPYDQAMPRLGICQNDSTSYFTDTCSFVFIATPLTIVRKWKQPMCPITDEWITEMWFIYATEYCLAENKK